MSILSNILHPIKAIEKWALQNFLKNIIAELPNAKEKVLAIWKEHKNEIFEKVKKSIYKAITDFIKKKMEESTNKNYVESDN